MELTAVFKKVPEGYIGWVEELPGANTQGETLEEARENLQEAIRLVFEANRELTERDLRGEEVLKESISLAPLGGGGSWCDIWRTGAGSCAKEASQFEKSLAVFVLRFCHA